MVVVIKTTGIFMSPWLAGECQGCNVKTLTLGPCPQYLHSTILQVETWHMDGVQNTRAWMGYYELTGGTHTTFHHLKLPLTATHQVVVSTTLCASFLASKQHTTHDMYLLDASHVFNVQAMCTLSSPTLNRAWCELSALAVTDAVVAKPSCSSSSNPPDWLLGIRAACKEGRGV
jgi:hypothetical protein